jgi:hypothetical protein
MIGRKNREQRTLFIAGDIEQFIPEDHILKSMIKLGMIKSGIALIAKRGYKIRSAIVASCKILEKVSKLLDNEDILVLGNKMRQERNTNLYDVGFFVGEKDSLEYLNFVKGIFKQAGI